MLSRAEADRHPSKIAKNSPDATTVMDGTTPTDAVPLIRFPRYHIAAGWRHTSTAVRSACRPAPGQVLGVDPNCGEHKQQVREAFTERATATRHPTNESRLIHLMKTETCFMDNHDYP